jgi:hypothetical protein
MGPGLQIRAWRSGVLKFSVRKDIMQKRVNARRTGEKNRKSTRGRLSKKLVNSHETELILCLCTKGFYLLLFMENNPVYYIKDRRCCYTCSLSSTSERTIVSCGVDHQADRLKGDLLFLLIRSIATI